MEVGTHDELIKKRSLYYKLITKEKESLPPKKEVDEMNETEVDNSAMLNGVNAAFTKKTSVNKLDEEVLNVKAKLSL